MMISSRCGSPQLVVLRDAETRNEGKGAGSQISLSPDPGSVAAPKIIGAATCSS